MFALDQLAAVWRENWDGYMETS